MNDRAAWTGKHWLTGQPIRVSAAGGRVMGVEVIPEPTEVSDLWLAPGLIDVQLNGIQGIDFNDPRTTTEEIREAVKALHARGVVRFCPTVVTADSETMSACIRTLAAACERFEDVAYAVLGIHVEGPFISDEDGPRGAHCRDQVRDPDWREFAGWQQAAGGRVRMVTIDPARTGACDFIRRLADEGVIAAIGHTGANEETVAAAIAAGATMSTHLGNGSHPLLPRHPNYIWTQLASDGLWAGLIADGHHLPASTLKSMIRAKGRKAILVSDANHFEGLPPGRYQKRNKHEIILYESGLLVMADTPEIFSGAATPLNKCVANVVRFGISSLGEAIEMASSRPAELFGGAAEGIGQLRPGAPADLIRYRSGGERLFDIMETIVAGTSVYRED